MRDGGAGGLTPWVCIACETKNSRGDECEICGEPRKEAIPTQSPGEAAGCPSQSESKAAASVSSNDKETKTAPEPESKPKKKKPPPVGVSLPLLFMASDAEPGAPSCAGFSTSAPSSTEAQLQLLAEAAEKLSRSESAPDRVRGEILLQQQEELSSLAIILQNELTIETFSMPISLTVAMSLPGATSKRKAAHDDAKTHAMSTASAVHRAPCAELTLLIPTEYPIKKVDSASMHLNAFIPDFVDPDAKISSAMRAHLVQFVRKNAEEGVTFLYDIVEEARCWLQTHVSLPRRSRRDRSGSPRPRKRSSSSQSKGSRSPRKTRPKKSEKRARDGPFDVLDYETCENRSRRVLDVETQATVRSISDSFRTGRACAKWHLYKSHWSGSAARESLRSAIARAQSDGGGKCAQPAPPSSCIACFDDLTASNSLSLSPCGHAMCVECWEGYIRSHVGSDSQVVPVCPGQGCVSPIPEGVLMALTTPDLYSNYRRWLAKAYTRANGWVSCRSPQCTRVSRGGFGSTPLRCRCGDRWCKDCRAAPHYPISCDVLRLYRESAHIQQLHKQFRDLKHFKKKNFSVVKVFTKKCPKCKTPWEKNGGCNHFSCTCGHEFCWVCLDSWNSHGTSYFECIRGKNRATVAKAVTFYENATEGLAQPQKISVFIDRECVHFAMVCQLKAIRPAGLDEIVKDIGQDGKAKIDRAFTSRVVTALADMHSLLGNCYILMCVQALLPGTDFYDDTKPFGAMLKDLFMFEYFVESLDNVILRMPWRTKRSQRDRDQINGLLKTIQKHSRLALRHVPALTLRYMAMARSFADTKSKSKNRRGRVNSIAELPMEQNWEDRESRLIASRPHNWSCERCTLYNEISAAVCSVCTAPRPRATSQALTMHAAKLQSFRAEKARALEVARARLYASIESKTRELADKAAGGGAPDWASEKARLMEAAKDLMSENIARALGAVETARRERA